MFQYKPSSGFEQGGAENQVRQCSKGIQLVRRIGKNDIVLLFQVPDDVENIGPVGTYIVEFQGVDSLSDKGNGTVIDIDQVDPGATRGKFIADTSRTCEQVEHCYFFEIEMIIQDIEEALLGKIGCGPRRKILTDRYMPPLVFTTYYTHITKYKTEKKRSGSSFFSTVLCNR